MLDESDSTPTPARAPIPTDKWEKTLVLNTIDGTANSIARIMPHLLGSCGRGLHMGKLASATNAVFIGELRQLADALETYGSKEFTLDDMRDYNGGL